MAKIVVWMPRFIGARCGTKVMVTLSPPAMAQFLLDLREMTVLGQTVGPQAFVALRVKQGGFRLPAGAAHAAGAAYHDGGGVKQSAPQQRNQRQ